MWHYGSEEAFALLPTFLLTGLTAVALSLVLGSVSFLVGLFIAITGYVPGQSDPEIIIGICWGFVFGGGLGLYLITFVAGFSCDIEHGKQGGSGGKDL